MRRTGLPIYPLPPNSVHRLNSFIAYLDNVIFRHRCRCEGVLCPK